MCAERGRPGATVSAAAAVGSSDGVDGNSWALPVTASRRCDEKDSEMRSQVGSRSCSESSGGDDDDGEPEAGHAGALQLELGTGPSDSGVDGIGCGGSDAVDARVAATDRVVAETVDSPPCEQTRTAKAPRLQ